MPGDLPAAVDVDHWRGIEGAFGVLGPTPGGVDRLVLEEQDRVGPTVDHMLVRRALQVPPILVRDRVGSEPDVLNDNGRLRHAHTAILRSSGRTTPSRRHAESAAWRPLIMAP